MTSAGGLNAQLFARWPGDFRETLSSAKLFAVQSFRWRHTDNRLVLIASIILCQSRSGGNAGQSRRLDLAAAAAKTVRGAYHDQVAAAFASSACAGSTGSARMAAFDQLVENRAANGTRRTPAQGNAQQNYQCGDF